jgi:hypothetical protein
VWAVALVVFVIVDVLDLLFNISRNDITFANLWRQLNCLHFLYRIYIEDNLYNCMHVNCRNWKWDFELSHIKWDKNEWQPWNIRGSWSVWKSEAVNPYTGLNTLCKMSEIHQIYQRIIFCAQLAGINLVPELWMNYYSQTLFLASKLEVPMINTKTNFCKHASSKNG